MKIIYFANELLNEYQGGNFQKQRFHVIYNDNRFDLLDLFGEQKVDKNVLIAYFKKGLAMLNPDTHVC